MVYYLARDGDEHGELRFASFSTNLVCNSPDNCIGLAYKFISYAELEGLLVSYIAWRMKYLKWKEIKK